MLSSGHKELLSSNEFFFCERMSCTLRKEVCVKRQKERPGRWGSREGYVPFEECINCEQGKRIKAEVEEDIGKHTASVRTHSYTKSKTQFKVICEVRKGENSMGECVCKECGKEFEPYKNGRRTIRSICKECLNVKKFKTRSALSLSVDFSEHSKLYQYLLERAKENFRSPEMEILAILNELKGE